MRARDDEDDDGLVDEDDERVHGEEPWLDDQDDASPTVPCPNCGEDMFDDAEWCPSCGQYVTANARPWAGRPWWWIGLGLAGIGAVVYLSLPW